MMEVEVVAPSDLEAALRDWERLFEADELATPFNSPSWARAWLEHWDPAAEPWLVRVRDGDRIAGIAPLALRRRRGLRLISMIGKEPGDYWDVIAASADREAVAATVGAELVRRRGQWDAGIINCLQPDSRTLRGLEATDLKLVRRVPVRSPAVPLPATFEQYLARLSRNRRGNFKRHLNRIDRGEVRVREIRDPSDVPVSMKKWRALRSRQWRAMGRTINPTHEEERFYRFLVEAATALLHDGSTVLWELIHNDQVAGVYLNFADAKTFYWYLGGFDPELSSLGVGKIAICASLRSSIEAGRELYDFTRGGDEYKYWYGAEDRLLESFVVGHGELRSRLAFAAARVLGSYRDRG